MSGNFEKDCRNNNQIRTSLRSLGHPVHSHRSSRRRCLPQHDSLLPVFVGDKLVLTPDGQAFLRFRFVTDTMVEA